MITRYSEHELMFQSSLYEKEDGEYISYRDYATLSAVARRLLDAMRTGVQLSFEEMDEIEELIGD